MRGASAKRWRGAASCSSWPDPEPARQVARHSTRRAVMARRACRARRCTPLARRSTGPGAADDRLGRWANTMPGIGLVRSRRCGARAARKRNVAFHPTCSSASSCRRTARAGCRAAGITNQPLPGIVWIQLPWADARRAASGRSNRRDAGRVGLGGGRRKFWLPARGWFCGVSSIERVWLSYTVSDQNFASGMPLGSVTLGLRAVEELLVRRPGTRAGTANRFPGSRIAIAGVMPVMP